MLPIVTICQTVSSASGRVLDASYCHHLSNSLISFRSCSRCFLLSPSVKQFHQLQVMFSVLPIVTICQTVSSASGRVLGPSYCHHLSNSFISFRSCSRSFLLSPSVKQFHQLQVVFSVLPIVTICQTASSASGRVLGPSYCHHLSNSFISFRSCSWSFLLSPSVKQFHQLQVVFSVLPIVTICQTVSSASGHVLGPSYCHHLSNSFISFRSCSRSFLLSPSVKQFHQLQVVFLVLPIVTICQTVSSASGRVLGPSYCHHLSNCQSFISFRSCSRSFLLSPSVKQFHQLQVVFLVLPIVTICQTVSSASGRVLGPSYCHHLSNSLISFRSCSRSFLLSPSVKQFHQLQVMFSVLPIVTICQTVSSA